MKGKEFLSSKWCQDAKSPQKQEEIKSSFKKWTTRVNNTGLLNRAKQLFQFFVSSDITGMQKVTVVGALLYIISPIDIIPDFIPVIGWMDDLGIASFALSYIFSQMDKIDAQRLNEGQDIQNCSSEELLEKEISGTTAEQEWDLKHPKMNSETTKNYQSIEIKSKIAQLVEITDTLSIDSASSLPFLFFCVIFFV